VVCLLEYLGYGNGNGGAVFIYELDPMSQMWVLSQDPLMNDDCNQHFGVSIGIATESNGLLIGCARESTTRGAVYYYTRSSARGQYELQQKITPINQKYTESFGWFDQIAVNGNFLSIGTSRQHVGRVILFTLLDGVWTEVMVIDGPADSEFFGFKVDMAGDDLLVSSQDNAYYYKLIVPPRRPTKTASPTWSVSPTQVPTSSLAPTQFALSVTLLDNFYTQSNPRIGVDGYSAVTVASTDNYGFVAVRLYSLVNGTFVEPPTIISLGADNLIGYVAISHDVVVIGDLSQKAVRVFEKDTSGIWYEQDAIIVTQGIAYGNTIGLDGNLLVVDDPLQRMSYIFRRRENAWIQEEKVILKQRSYELTISVKGDLIVFGDGGHQRGKGAVFVYTYDASGSWMQIQGPILNDECVLGFGGSIAIVPETNGFLVGCGNGSSMAGSVYYYIQDSDSGTYQVHQTISSPWYENTGDSFAKKIVVDGKIMVTADAHVEGGIVFVYSLVDGFWKESAVIHGPEGPGGFGFGESIGLSGHNLLISSNSFAHHYKLETGSLLSPSPSVSLFPSISPAPSHLP